MARDEAKRDEWRRRIERQRRSGRTVQAFCLDEGIAPGAFYYWKRVLRRELAATGTGSQAAANGWAADAAGPVGRLGEASIRFEQGRFFPVTVLGDADSSASATLEIEFPQGVRLHVRAGCDRGLLRDVLEWCRSTTGGEPC